MTGDETQTDPDIPYRWVEGGLPDPEIRGGGGLKQIFFRPFGPFGQKKGPGPFTGSATVKLMLVRKFCQVT